MDTFKKQKTIRKQVSKRLESLREFKSATLGISSWSKYLRDGLGMSLSQLAQRVGVAPSTMNEAEKREREGTVTINKLKQVANALECDLVYAFVPRKKLEEILHDQAHLKAIQSIKAADTHMTLEDQKVETDEARLKEILEEKLDSKYLWDQDE